MTCCLAGVRSCYHTAACRMPPRPSPTPPSSAGSPITPPQKPKRSEPASRSSSSSGANPEGTAPRSTSRLFVSTKTIADMADKFVRVRLVKIAGMDLRRFEFDRDLNWFAFFLNADETIYGRYGGRDATDAEARLSPKGLRYALERALEAHKRLQGR